MVGEMDYEGNFIDIDMTEIAYFTQTIYFMFLFFISITVFNLILSVTVEEDRTLSSKYDAFFLQQRVDQLIPIHTSQGKNIVQLQTDYNQEFFSDNLAKMCVCLDAVKEARWYEYITHGGAERYYEVRKYQEDTHLIRLAHLK